MVTVVLVHGAFADASSWNGIIDRLQKQGHAVVAPANPLRGLADDTAYIASVVDQIDGPVLLVGHSYAGAIISNIVAKARNVVGNNLPQEAPQAFADAIVEVDGY